MFPICDRQRREPLPRSKLTAPTTTDSESAAFLAVVGFVGGVSAVDGVFAWGCGGGVRVDAVCVGARRVGVVADAGEGGECPLGGRCHHGDCFGGGGEGGESEEGGC